MLGLAVMLPLVCASSATSVEAAQITPTSTASIETMVDKFRAQAARKRPEAWVLMRTGEIFQGESNRCAKAESLTSILPVAETELDRWSFAVDAGFKLSVGNSDE